MTYCDRCKRHVDSATLGLWQLNPAAHEALGPTGWQPLTPLEYKLMEYLVQHEGRTCTRRELLREVWGLTLMPHTRTVDQFFSRLRRKFAKPGEKMSPYFKTFQGAGYRFVRNLEEET